MKGNIKIIYFTPIWYYLKMKYKKKKKIVQFQSRSDIVAEMEDQFYNRLGDFTIKITLISYSQLLKSKDMSGGDKSPIQ